ncbi:DUF930 domain-containing protein [Ancylobacter amanitiformis]|uniref:DUF930 domain-containing protein n=1 Tax=Ancylobacter amanitiformis TaxID=217069 RepID=A0ABU0LW15_9HYPH|nr:DUF930 domain-containing protein [Ancylobacter amanitiformis]MDQ0512922.1 hypothetical protein [Ancylobacter amanitiformis]
MRLTTAIVLYCTAALVPAAHAKTATGADPHPHRQEIAREMAHIDPSFRGEQRCDARAMGDVRRQHPDMSPDELVAYAFAEVKVAGVAVRAPGAAVRSKGSWYHLSYICQTTPDGLDIVSLDHVLGEKIPRSEWEPHSLVAP